MTKHRCPICREACKSEKLVFEHVYYKHLEHPAHFEDKPYVRICPCGWSSGSPGGFRWHVQTQLKTTLIRHLVAAGLGISNDSARTN